MASAPNPIVVSNLGLGGVNLVKSPLEMSDQELTQAQNAEPYRDQGVAGIRKRAALRPINASALAAIQGIVAVEIASSGAGNNLGSPGDTDIPASGSQGLVLVARNTHPGTSAWKYTTDGGASWATTTALTRNIANADHNAIVYKGRAFYPGEDDSAGQILCFDGSKEFEFCRLPGGPSVATAGGTGTNAVGIAGGLFYFANGNGTTSQLYAVDPNTGSATIVGGPLNGANEIFTDVCLFGGRLYACTNAYSGDITKAAHIYSIKPDVETVWTTERTTTDLGTGVFRGYNSLTVFQGQLYAALGAPAGYAAIIERLDASGTWSTELTSGDTTNANYYDALIVWNSGLYALYGSNAPAQLLLQWASAGTWSTRKDLNAAGATTTWGFLPTPTKLYASAPPRVFTSADGTTWATSLSDAAITHGMLI